MASNNGHHPPPFGPIARSVPLVGQPAKVHAILATAVFTCGCSPHLPQVVAVDSVVTCASCGQMWTIGELHYSKQPRQFHIEMGKVVAAPAPTT